MLRPWKSLCGTASLVALAYVALLCGTTNAQQGNASAALFPGHTPTANPPLPRFKTNKLTFPMPTMMPSLFPLFIEDGNMSSKLTLANASSLQTYATLTVRDEAGRSWQSPRIEFAPHAQVELQVADLLQRMGLHLAYGSMVLNPSPRLKAQSIVGQLTLSRTASSPVSYAEEEEFMLAMMPSHSLLAVAEASNLSPRVGISSMSATDQHVAVRCTRNGAISTQQITLPPNGLAILKPCDSSASSDGEDGDSPLYPAAISITTDGPAGELSAFGITRHRSVSAGAEYIGALQFFDPASFNSSSLVFSGISSGHTLTPDNARLYTSQIAIANFGATPTNADLVVYRTSVDHDVAPSRTKITVPSVSVVQVSLGDLGTSSQCLASVIVNAAAPSGTVLAKLVSTSDSAPYQLEQLVKDALDEHNAGIHPWSLDNGSVSDLLLFNHSDGSQPFNVVIEAPGGIEWVKRIAIAAHETMDFSLDTLIANKVKDDRGRLIPSSATHGTVIWTNGPGLGTGRMLVRNAGEFAAHSFSCGGTSSICGAEPLGEVDLNQGDSVTLFPQGVYCNLTDGCTGEPSFDGSAEIDGAWSDDDTIATIDLGGNVQGKSPGTTAVYLDLTDGSGCDEQTSGNAVVGFTVTGSPNSGSSASDLWYFGGQSPSGYATSITLTSSAGAATSWHEQDQTGEGPQLHLSSTSGAQITVTSNGVSYSSALDDVVVVATVNGSSYSYAFTTHVPFETVPGNIVHKCDPSYGYDMNIYYTIDDQMGSPLPSEAPINEFWASAAQPDYSNTNWGQPPTQSTTSGPSFYDDIQGEYSGQPPNPAAVCNPGNGTTKVVHWLQDWYIGSLTSGAGALVQTDTLQKFTDHAEHDAILTGASLLP